MYSCLANPMDGGAWWAAVHGVARSRTQLSDFTFTFHFHALEKGMATHSSVLAWRIPGAGEPGGLPSLGWHRVGHGWSDLAAAAGSDMPYHMPAYATQLVMNHSGPVWLSTKWAKMSKLDGGPWLSQHSDDHHPIFIPPINSYLNVG